MTTTTPETAAETTPAAGDPKPAAKTYKLNWREHARACEPPVHVCRIRPGGRQLQISLMSFLEHKLGDKPLCGDQVYVHLSSFGLMPHMGDAFSRFQGRDDRAQLGWLAFETVTVFLNGMAPLDPDQGPLTTTEERIAAVLRSYPVAVEMLKAYCDDLFDPYEGENLGAAFDAACDAVVAGAKPRPRKRRPIVADVFRAAAGPMPPEQVAALRTVVTKLGEGWEQVPIARTTVGELLETDPGKLLDALIAELTTEGSEIAAKLGGKLDATPDPIAQMGGMTTIVVPGGMSDGVTDLPLPWLGLNRRDAVEKAIETAKEHGKSVTLTHGGVAIVVQADDELHPTLDRFTVAAGEAAVDGLRAVADSVQVVDDAAKTPE
jgi:hypothetical protein